MPRSHYNVDWTIALVGWMRQTVENHFRSDLFRWPLMHGYEARIYGSNDAVRLITLHDRGPTNAANAFSSGDRALDWPDNVERVTAFPTHEASLPALLERMYTAFDLRQQDAAFFLSVFEGTSTQQEWDECWTPEMKRSLEIQLSYAIGRQLQYVRGFDRVGQFVLPPGYEFLSRECERFFEDHPNYDRNVFLMTRFDAGSRVLVSINEELRCVLRQNGYNPVRVDDKMYMPDRNLWNNVCVYMLCSSLGVAILEDRVADEFNPNVALEYGFMRALNKRTLLLADQGFRKLRADIIGTLRNEFDLTDIEGTVQPAVERWLVELG
jgi:hypothetical protein